ncbi:maleylpyruvate isomerase family mycothiol-dependent enzyme [Propionibacterium australiense]|uniref:Maleylpyruvate isomerase family mycothiol-dependent enzyme n=1 Tax=Propionibacterium australiense TaxID=119981 RepID=A0A383S452_9ACTN|nr:maleylpyruvate isomerase family mycothiol-dependent enzyme [Propionibacterium australiense]RLP11147.1 maleylpyruvate isomerase family mycothiol-dependent enzyme [Propionibacterium australiense]RLP12476.1 maleylpyruvate isomerase family mycothiol-dependent enzyme [Propionibacterium australiense]SYZ32707.1 Mycothiol maleylpyruvate isomerase N-terminal domain [Propionibacterium australiense]VEH91504.1 mycothiol-dependent maleylpyruvate isomerase [Propionibacterium australiense]
MPSLDDQRFLPGAGDVRLVRRRKLEATQQLLGDTIMIEEDAWHAPSALPGWSRAHVATHLARGADALARLAESAPSGGTGIPLYLSDRDRFTDVERGAERRALDLQIDLDTSAGRLHRSFDKIDAQSCAAPVDLGDGRLVRLDLLPLARLREVLLHRVDLDCGFSITDADDDIARWVLEWTCYWLAGDESLPALQVESTSGFHARLGARGRPIPVGGSDALLLGWLTGRLPGNHPARAELPELPEGWRT